MVEVRVPAPRALPDRYSLASARHPSIRALKALTLCETNREFWHEIAQPYLREPIMLFYNAMYMPEYAEHQDHKHRNFPHGKGAVTLFHAIDDLVETLFSDLTNRPRSRYWDELDSELRQDYDDEDYLLRLAVDLRQAMVRNERGWFYGPKGMAKVLKIYDHWNHDKNTLYVGLKLAFLVAHNLSKHEWGRNPLVKTLGLEKQENREEVELSQDQEHVKVEVKQSEQENEKTLQQDETNAQNNEQASQKTSQGDPMVLDSDDDVPLAVIWKRKEPGANSEPKQAAVGEHSAKGKDSSEVHDDNPLSGIMKNKKPPTTTKRATNTRQERAEKSGDVLAVADLASSLPEIVLGDEIISSGDEKVRSRTSTRQASATPLALRSRTPSVSASPQKMNHAAEKRSRIKTNRPLKGIGGATVEPVDPFAHQAREIKKSLRGLRGWSDQLSMEIDAESSRIQAEYASRQGMRNYRRSMGLDPWSTTDIDANLKATANSKSPEPASIDTMEQDARLDTDDGKRKRADEDQGDDGRTKWDGFWD